jgi:hypothetical protein
MNRRLSRGGALPSQRPPIRLCDGTGHFVNIVDAQGRSDAAHVSFHIASAATSSPICCAKERSSRCRPRTRATQRP